MGVHEYDIISGSGQECSNCGTTEDIVMDEDGEIICTDCLFERTTEEMFSCDCEPNGGHVEYKAHVLDYGHT